MEKITLPFTDSFRTRVKIFCDGQDISYDQAVERVSTFINDAQELHLQSLCDMHDLAQLKIMLEHALNKYVKEA